MSIPSTTRALRVEDMSWVEFDERAGRVPYWIVAAGSVEQHGPHLPLGADTFVVERLAEIASERHGSVILGTIRIGVLHAYQDWPGTQRVPADVLSGQISALCELPTRYANRLLVLNGHDENHEVIMLTARGLSERHGTDVVVVEWAQLIRDVIQQVSESKSEAHGGEALTSLFLHWFPDRVRTDRIEVGTLPADGLMREDLHVTRRANHVRRVSRESAPSGVIGDPTRADADKGAALATALVERVDALTRERGWR